MSGEVEKEKKIIYHIPKPENETRLQKSYDP